MATCVFRFVNVLIRLWGQMSKVKVTAGNDPKTCEHHISKTNEGDFTQFRSQMYFGLYMCWLDFGVQRSKVKVTAGNVQKTFVTTYVKKLMKGISPNFGHRYISVCRCAY